jgi:crossover junction endodeoxyribonuclease RuvC
VLIIGIDPGATGAIAFYSTETRVLNVVDMPVVKIERGKRTVSHVDPVQLTAEIDFRIGMLVRPEEVHAYVEKVGSMPGQGVASMFAFGRAAGVVEGVLAGLGVAHTLVPPQTWIKFAAVVGGKDGSRQRAGQMFPAAAHLFSRAKDDGRADAALIAYYGAFHQSKGAK